MSIASENCAWCQEANGVASYSWSAGWLVHGAGQVVKKVTDYTSIG